MSQDPSWNRAIRVYKQMRIALAEAPPEDPDEVANAGIEVLEGAFLKQEKEIKELKKALHEEVVFGRSYFNRDPATCGRCYGRANRGEYIEHEDDCVLAGYKPEYESEVKNEQSPN